MICGSNITNITLALQISGIIRNSNNEIVKCQLKFAINIHDDVAYGARDRQCKFHQRIFVNAYVILDLHGQKTQGKDQVHDNYVLQVSRDYTYQYTKLFQPD